MDTSLVTWLNGLAQHPVARQTADAGARFLVALPVLIAVGLTIWTLWRRDTTAFASLFVAAIGMGTALGFNVIATSAWYRARPYTALAQVHPLIATNAESSFYSDHTVVATGCAIAALLVSRRWGLLAATAAIVVGVSRIAVGAHYPTDVLAAAAITTGAILALLPLRARLAEYLDPLAERLPAHPQKGGTPAAHGAQAPMPNRLPE